MSDNTEDLPLVAKPSWLGKITRNEVSDKEIEEARQVIEDDAALAGNGWTPEVLAKYFKERKEAQANVVLHRVKVRPTRTNGWHNAHRWRR